jgi:hypothetical protein
MEKTALTPSSMTSEKLVQLAVLLEQAVKLMREIGLSGKTGFKPDIPDLKRPKHVLKGQEWFWSDEWQASEREVNDALARGQYEIFDSAKELIADLHRHV